MVKSPVVIGVRRIFDHAWALSILCLSLLIVIALELDYNGSLKSITGCNGHDICGGYVFQSIIILWGTNE